MEWWLKLNEFISFFKDVNNRKQAKRACFGAVAVMVAGGHLDLAAWASTRSPPGGFGRAGGEDLGPGPPSPTGSGCCQEHKCGHR